MNRCTACHHVDRLALERAYIGGATIRALAEQFSLNKNTVHKHVKEHVPAVAQKAIEAANGREIKAGDSAINELATLCAEARRLQAVAEKQQDVRTAIAALRELVRIVELKARMVGELRDREVNVTVVQIDEATATRMAEVFLARRSARSIQPAVIDVAAGVQPAPSLQVGSK